MAALILTNIGLAKLASATPLDQLEVSHVAVGDSADPIDPTMTALNNEVWRGDASAAIRDPSDAKVLIFEGVIPSTDGGFTIREVGLFDVDGDLIAIGHTDTIDKPDPIGGTPVTMTLRVRLTLANADQTNLIVADAPYVDHQGTTNRDAEDAHPIPSISGLQDRLVGLAASLLSIRTKQTVDAGHSGWFNAITYGNGLFVAVGNGGAIQTSPDGVTWTARTAGGGYTGNFRSIVWVEDLGLFVAGGDAGGPQTSPDGVTWTQQSFDSMGGAATVVYGDGLIVAASSSQVEVSADGINWTNHALTTPFPIPSGPNPRAGAFGDGVFVLVGADGMIQSSDDGINWTVRTADGGYTGIFAGAAYGRGLFVAAGQSGEIQTSPDGVTWTSRQSGLGADFSATSVALCGPHFVVGANYSRLFISDDGVKWAHVYPIGVANQFVRAIAQHGDYGLLALTGEQGLYTTPQLAV